MNADLVSLERLLARTTRRLRLQRALECAAWVAAAGATGAAFWLLFEPHARWPLGLCAAGTTLAFAFGAALPVAVGRSGLAIDRAGDLAGRVRAASEFLQLERARRTDFIEAALRDASLRARAIRPSQAAPLERPRASLLALLAIAACALITARSTANTPPREARLPRPPSERLVALAPEDMAARDDAARALGPARAPEREDALGEYLALLARLRAHALGQEEALQQALAIEAKLARQTRAAGREEHPALRQLAAELATARPALAKALARGELTEAIAQLRKLAKSVATKALAPRERDALRAALEQARARERARADEQERERAREQSLESQLLRDRDRSEPSVLKRRREAQRELEQLRQKRAEVPERLLEKLSRELGRAGQALSDGDARAASNALDDASSQLERHEQEQQQQARLDQAQQRELSREVSQLRELLQQRALADESDARPPSQQRGQQGPSEGPQPGLPSGSAEDSSAATARDKRQQRERFDLHARGESGDHADGGTSARLVSGGRAGTTEVLVPGQAVVAQARLPTPLERPGSDHDTTQLEAPTRRPGRYEDRTLEGSRGAGPTRSQVIRSAAQSGFANAPYRKVYGDYRAHAEALIERDEVPAGYRFHVRRYFELVRPREGQDTRP